MISLLSVLALCALGIYALRTWQAVRMAQLTDTGIRAEWADYRGEVDGALDEVVRQVGEVRDLSSGASTLLSEHDGRLKRLEDEERRSGLKRVAGVR